MAGCFEYICARKGQKVPVGLFAIWVGLSCVAQHSRAARHRDAWARDSSLKLLLSSMHSLPIEGVQLVSVRPLLELGRCSSHGFGDTQY